jgi:imidazolonepropionase-like amidohydrolase
MKVLMSVVLVILATFLVHAQSSSTVAIKARHLVDTRAGRVLENQVVLIVGDRVQAVGRVAEVTIPAGAKVIDLSSATVLPGLVDLHTHLNDEPEFHGVVFHTLSGPRMALIGAKGARMTLEAGFTTARNMGSSHYADVALRDAINAGDIPGPRMQVTGPMIGSTGSHCDYTYLAPEFHYNDEGVANGVAAVQEKVR